MKASDYTPRRVREEFPPYPEDTVIELPVRHRRQFINDTFVIDALLAVSIIAALAALAFYMTHL